ncbi:GNAT family N-acetyltransferase [Gemmata sp.]|uniref:GNAT family N-acetyltransferase n=1 Tax=Gemmata sp. TaxID=1914242 RepID=UPI003F7221EB
MVTIRPASEGDLPGLIEMARRSWLSGFTAAPPQFVSDWLARDFERAWYTRYWPDMSVAEEDGVLLGVVQPMRDEVNGLWVEPAAQGRGVGTLLLRHAEGYIAAAHGRSWLTCSAFNPRGCRFYLARGYREVGRQPKERAGGVVEEMRTYERRLTGRTTPLQKLEGHEVEEPSCTIRRAVPDDAAPLAGLAARTFRETFEADNRPEDIAEHLAASYGTAQQLAEITSPEIVTLLATCDGLAAFAQLRRGKAPPCVTSTETAELWRFYVDRGWHGRGIAKRLMQAVLEEASASGATTVWLGVWERNPRAIAFYRKLGFEDVGAHEFRLGTDVQTDRIMVRNLEVAPKWR